MNASIPVDQLYLKWMEFIPASIREALSANQHVIIPIAVLGSGVALIVHNLWPRSAKELEHIPSISFRKAIGIFVDQKTPFDRKYEISREELPQEARRLYKVPLGVLTILNVGSPEAAKQIFDQSNFKKNGLSTTNIFGYPSFFFYFFGLNIANTNDPDWSRHRVVLKPAFSRPLRTAPFIESASQLIRTFHSIKDTSSVDVYSWMQRLTLDVLGRVIFSFDFLSLKDPVDPGMYVRSWNEMMIRLFNPLFALYPILCYIPTKWVARTWTLIKEFKKLLIRIIDERNAAMKEVMTKNEKDMDLLDMMLIACQNEKGFTMEDVVADLCGLFVAGHDTTANVLALALYFMAKHKDVQEKAREEVYSVLGKPETREDAINIGPEHTQLGKFKYINAIMKEVMRLYPSIPSIPTRMALKDVPIKFRDFNGVEREEVIPKGTRVAVDVFGMQRDPQYYHDPSAFKPERWLNESYETAEAEGLRPWMPFGGGARICLGMQFSLVEQKVTLAMILRNFELNLPVKNGVAEELKLHSGGLLLRPERLGIELKPII